MKRFGMHLGKVFYSLAALFLKEIFLGRRYMTILQFAKDFGYEKYYQNCLRLQKRESLKYM